MSIIIVNYLIYQYSRCIIRLISKRGVLVTNRTIGKLIKSLRKEKGLTLVELSKLSGVSNSYLSQVENDQFNPKPDILKKLSGPLDQDLQDMLRVAGYLEENTFGKKLEDYITEQDDSEKAIEHFAEAAEIPLEVLEEVISNKVHVSPDVLDRIARTLGNLSYSQLLKDAGYEELARKESMKEVLIDFGSNETLLAYFERIQSLEEALDMKILLEGTGSGFDKEEIQGFYNGHRLSDEDKKRLGNIIKEVFPEYEELGTDFKEYQKSWISKINAD